MPTYDYHCDECGNRFDAWQKMTDEPLTVCPTCAGRVHRVIHPTGIVFKGSGFYSTDQRGSQESVKPAPAEPAAAGTGGDQSAAASGEPGGAKPVETAGQPGASTPATSPAPPATSASSKAAR